MIIATTTEQGTNEDTEAASRVTRSIADNYLRRPSIEDRAVHMLATMANNDLSMISQRDEEPSRCDGAYVFVNHNKARFLTAGDSVAYHFVGGELDHRSDEGVADSFGIGPRYEPNIGPIFELQLAENAFLTASGSLAAAVSAEAICEALRASGTPENWMEQLTLLAGPETQFCAVATFLPVKKHSRLRALISRVTR